MMNALLRKLMVQGGYMEEANGGEQGGAGGAVTEPGGMPAGDSNGGGNNGGAGDGKGGQGKTQDHQGEKTPSDEEAKLIKEVMSKKKALDAATVELNEIKTKLKDFDGLDAAEIKKLVAAQKAAEQAELEKKGEWDRLKQQMADQHATEKKTLEEQLQIEREKRSGYETQIAELTVGNAFGGSKYVSDDLHITAAKTRKLYGEHFEYEGGQIVGYDKPAGAKNRTLLVDARGEPVHFDEALKRIVDADPDKDSILKSKVKPGSGSNTGKPSEQGGKSVVNHDQGSNQRRGVSRISAALKTKK